MSARVEAPEIQPAPPILQHEGKGENPQSLIPIETITLPPPFDAQREIPRRITLREKIGFSKEQVLEIITAVPNLTDDERLLLGLRMEKRSSEISHDLHLSDQTIYYRLRQIRKKVRSELGYRISPEIEALVFSKQPIGRPRKNRSETINVQKVKSLREKIGFSKEKIRQVISVIPGLDENERLLLELRLEKSIREVTTDLHASHETLYKRIYKIQEKVREEFGAEIPPEVNTVVFAHRSRKFSRKPKGRSERSRPIKNNVESTRHVQAQRSVEITDFLSNKLGGQEQKPSKPKFSPSKRRQKTTSHDEEQTYLSFSNEEEVEIVQKAQKGDRESISILCQYCWRKSYLYCLRRVESPFEAEDLASQVIEKVLTKLSEFEFRGAPFSAWVFRIAHNTLVSSLRKHKAQEGEQMLENKPSLDPLSNPQEFVETRMLNLQVREVTKKLSENQRRIIYLRFSQGLSVSETAQRIRMSESNVKVIQHKAIARLRGILSKDGFSDILPNSSEIADPSVMEKLQGISSKKLDLIPHYIYRVVNLYRAGKKKGEIAQILGLSYLTVGDYLSRARRYFR